LRYSDAEDLAQLDARFAQMQALGCHDFALLFDDLPDRLPPLEVARFASFATAQCHVAHDCDGRRFYCGPSAGRPPKLRAEVRGLLANPNCELPLNDVRLRTLAEFARGGDPWDPRAAYP